MNKQNNQNAMWIIDCRNAFCLQAVSKSISRSHTHTYAVCVVCVFILYCIAFWFWFYFTLFCLLFFRFSFSFSPELNANLQCNWWKTNSCFSVVLSLAATASSMVIDSSLFVLFFLCVFRSFCFCWLFVIAAVRVSVVVALLIINVTQTCDNQFRSCYIAMFRSNWLLLFRFSDRLGQFFRWIIPCVALHLCTFTKIARFTNKQKRWANFKCLRIRRHMIYIYISNVIKMLVPISRFSLSQN